MPLIPEKINRLILIGNGFDLAHQLKTSYNDFIIYYLTTAMEKAHVDGIFQDELVTIQKTDFFALSQLNGPKLDNIPAFVEYYYRKGFGEMLNNQYLKFEGWLNNYLNPFKFRIGSDLMLTLLYDCSHSNWVDIENVFYDKLKAILRKSSSSNKKAEIGKLNSSLKKVIEYLEMYLSDLDVSSCRAEYQTILESKFDPEEFVGLTESDQQRAEIDLTMILNFNYTSTIENYVSNSKNDKFSLNYIHGKLGDPINRPIFGFGDELDQDYASFELDRTKGIFEYIKSFWYFKTSNYHNLIRFIDSAPYQVYTLGHSCGLSDRTMLNMIFEHKNCKSIKIFYHQTEDTNNYTALTQEIARHFRNKQDMRRKIVPLSISLAMPQIEIP